MPTTFVTGPIITGVWLAIVGAPAPSVPVAPPGPSFMDAVRDAFLLIDTDRDGVIEFGEYRNFAFAAFDEADVDGDLVLTMGEVGSDPGDRAVFVKLDREKDGVVTLGEFMRLQRLLFDFADLDLDGTVSAPEYLAVSIASRYGWLDADGDHRLTAEEFTAALIRAMANFDADRSGTLSGTEAAGFDQGLAMTASPITVAEFVERYRELLPDGVR